MKTKHLLITMLTIILLFSNCVIAVNICNITNKEKTQGLSMGNYDPHTIYSPEYAPYSNCHHDNNTIDPLFTYAEAASACNNQSGVIAGYAFGSNGASANAEAWQDITFYTTQEKTVHVTATIKLAYAEEKVTGGTGETKIGHIVNNGEKKWDKILNPFFGPEDHWYLIKQLISTFLGIIPGSFTTAIDLIMKVFDYFVVKDYIDSLIINDQAHEYTIEFDMLTKENGYNTISIGARCAAASAANWVFCNSSFTGLVEKVRIDGLDTSNLKVTPREFIYDEPIDIDEIIQETIRIENTGPKGSFLDWEIYHWPDWVDVLLPKHGSDIASGEYEEVTFKIKPLGMIFGEYSGSINVQDYRLVATIDVDIDFAYVSRPPTKPTITGPTQGEILKKYTYSFVSTDPDNNNIHYQISIDGITSEPTDPYNSGETVNFEWIWTEEGEHSLSVKAIDTYGVKSETETMYVTAPKQRCFLISIFNRLIEKYPSLNLFS